MADDTEKRFHSFMDKLFHSSKSTLSSSSPPPQGRGRGREGQLLRAKKRPNPSYVEEKQLCLVATESPLCRPWDRGYLLRRLSSFKSMTWFAKPKVVSAVNCALRGWVNVDMDILACESCGARLLFSTPPSWTWQQVEKAASVFSLKLDSGHKLLCPWIDNVCDERLAEFPPTVPADLVDKFWARSNSLFQLMALPVISSSAIEFMRSPQLDEFLRQPLMVDCLRENVEFSQLEGIEDGSAVDSANLYYQAQKLISLCGWESRSLPYVVDCKDGQNQFSKDAEILSSPQGADYQQNLCLNFRAADENENLEANKDFENSFRLQYDPKSVVLECRLCGASVGLWTFNTVQRPVEFFRLFGCEVNHGAHDSGHENNVCYDGDVVPSNGGSSIMEQSSNLKLTIAGGPLPTRQNFKAQICLPVIGQCLSARFLYHQELRDQIYSNLENTPVESEFRGEIDCFSNSVSEPGVLLEEFGTSNSIKDGQVNCSSKSNDQSPCSNHDVCARDDNFRNVAPLEGTDITTKEISRYAGTDDSNMGVQIQSSQNVVQDSCQGKDLKQLHMDKVSEFDPIRQHRHFCPWIASMSGEAPGWQQTLSALLCGKDFPHSSPACSPSPSSASMIKVTDPIASVRKLLLSPVTKRMKIS